jgi:hypothetical protein
MGGASGGVNRAAKAGVGIATLAQNAESFLLREINVERRRSFVKVS